MRPERTLLPPPFSGRKFPTFDFLLELVDDPGCFFFVQVKTTTQGFTTSHERLRVQVSETDIHRMVNWKAPSYVVGIDERNGRGYLLSVNESRGRVASLPTDFKIDCNVLQQLYDEVRRYWASRDMALPGSAFNEQETRRAE